MLCFYCPVGMFVKDYDVVFLFNCSLLLLLLLLLSLLLIFIISIAVVVT